MNTQNLNLISAYAFFLDMALNTKAIVVGILSQNDYASIAMSPYSPIYLDVPSPISIPVFDPPATVTSHAPVSIPPSTQSSIPPPTPTSKPSANPGSTSLENIRRSNWVRQVPAHLRDYHCYATLLSNHWQATIQEELQALDKAQRPIGACRLLDGEFEETWMKRGSLLLSSLQTRRPVRSPGNGCNWTGNGGNPCIGSKKVAQFYTVAPPPPLPYGFTRPLVQLVEATS
ncbi:hypothetical protein OSB04_000916 [Centaurea solstitialis]|uniref:Uncharacterized protein n=1 Tax=Centaurea solstitialis TaxID=347529 RepID=A0AA38WSD5_9ASTR|nr:hypothetical protein OSB04_000916 [Centaurea solstitialis]